MKDAESAESKINQISDFSYFYSSSYGHFCSQITPICDEFL